MGKIQKKGEKGAAKAYVTRSAAVKKLQCSLADFRRLCILKGIFPREPRHKKRANKGSTAPTTFYYAKDIAYIAHEPVLRKLREHKAFAKKLSRALGRGEWSSAKSLEDHKPTYTLDHVIKERYPTFIDALRDIDDALCLITLFASLPSDSRVSPALIESCYRLSSEWQLYVMHTRSLRKVFLSIKGVYYQAEVMGETVTWLVPYMFTQQIPTDVDTRVMLTFLELYQTLLGFVFFKLYSDAGLVYPPPLDLSKDEGAAGVGAFSLLETKEEEKADEANAPSTKKQVEVEGKVIKGKDVRKTIKELANLALPPQEATSAREISAETSTLESTIGEEFVVQPSSNASGAAASLPTLHTLSTLPAAPTTLFAPYTIWLTIGTPRPLLEFAIRAFGGRVGWPETMGSGSPITEDDESITHVIIDRPLPANLAPEQVELRRRRKYVQPQWVVDCINAGKLIIEGPYAQGATLPPHLSPFGELEGAYMPAVGEESADAEMEAAEDEESEDEEVAEGEEEAVAADADAEMVAEPATASALEAAAKAPSDPALLRAAELEAERAGLDSAAFEEKLKKAVKKAKKSGTAVVKEKKEADEAAAEGEMNKMMMSNKQRKLYERMKYSERKRTDERKAIEVKKELIRKEEKKKARKSAAGGK
ncbi:hypothetical protein BOTBODRAFT_129635 [Botryobasidium botryosum FD-172 SS1]|uniref:Pescadillo homolog n=1 Tax=Botryobasidium botryosum (strain FD-172 SS1) TaxID=930990 RepID=A0A067MPV1_BOTB1|nr:hypothetical protein BOTBODRAFT_129635 [Botryobasidium botryosum FD-172 SS1]